MIPIPAAFSGSYAEARTKFNAAAEAAGLDVHAHVHPLVGRDGEVLAMDVVREGPRDMQVVVRCFINFFKVLLCGFILFFGDETARAADCLARAYACLGCLFFRLVGQ